MGEAYWSNKKRVLGMIEKNPCNLYKASKELRDDKEVVMAAVQKGGYTLEFASERLQDDEDVVIAAVQENGIALNYASQRLCDDKTVVMAAAAKSGRALEYVSEQFLDDKDIIMAVARGDGFCLGFASERLQNDKDIFLTWIDSFLNREDFYDLDGVDYDDYYLDDYLIDVFGIPLTEDDRRFLIALISIKSKISEAEAQACFNAAPPKVIGEVLKEKETALKFITLNPMYAHWLDKAMLEDAEIRGVILDALNEETEKWIIDSVGSLYNNL